MFRHNLLLAYRNFKRYKNSFIINLIGLSSGLACALFIYFWVISELHIDKFHEKDGQLFQVMKNVATPTGILTMEYTPGRLAEALKEEIPEIEYSVSVVPSERFSTKGTLSVNPIKVKVHGQYISKDYFDVFSFNFIHGGTERLFSDQYNVAISSELATRLFGSIENVIGQVVEWNHEMLPGQYVIGGILEDPPISSTRKFDVLFSYDLFIENNPKLEEWTNSDPNTYVIVKEGTDVAELQKEIADFIKEKNPNSKEAIFLQQYSKRYLYGRFENGVQADGRITYVRLFSLIGILLLVVACINFMNLSTAKALKRSKEVGVKKAIGAARGNLLIQYMGESILMTFLSSILAFIVVLLLLPWFADITGKPLAIGFDLNLAAAVLIIITVTGFIAGSYPAIYLSGFKPVAVLKGKLTTNFSEIWTRKALIVLQFVVSVIMIVFALVIYHQTKLVQTKNLGYSRGSVLYFEKGDEHDQQEGEAYKQQLESFLQAVKSTPGVVNASNFRHSIVERNGGTSDITWPGKGPDVHLDFTDLPVGYDFIETLGIEMKEGRSFSREFSSEKSKVIFNETAILNMGLEHPIGKVVKIWGEDREIIGVAKDFHFQSFYENIKPLFFDFSLNPRVSNIMVEIESGTEKETIERLEKLYGKYNHGLAFEYTFLDNDYQSLYESENRIAMLSKYFTGLAILISCLGLFGLAAFTAERRLKEIGIRKILGSSEYQIVRLLTGDFTKMLLIAILIALPISYFVTNCWLTGFAYRITLEWWFFAAAGLTTLFIAWLTVGVETLKASKVNPVQCLKEE